MVGWKRGPGHRLLAVLLAVATSPAIAQGTCSDFGILAGTDFHSSEFLGVVPSLGANGVTACCEECTRLAAQCTAFVVAGAACYLKGGQLTPYENAGVTGYQLLMPPSPPAAPHACTTYNMWPSTDLEAPSFYGTATASNDDAAECCSACSRTHGCTGFAERGGACYLKGGGVLTFVTGREGVTSYTLMMPPSPPAAPHACTGWDVQPGADYGSTLSFGVASAPGGDTSECCTVCMATSGCSAFVLLGEACYLKGGQLTSAGNAATTTYLMPNQLRAPSPPAAVNACDSFQVTPQSDVSGINVGFLAAGALNIESCCEACLSQAGCLGFAEQYGFCWLKANGVNGGSTVAVTPAPFSAVSAYMLLLPPSPPSPPDACGPFQTTTEADVTGTFLAYHGAGANNVASCCTVCLATAGCIGFAELTGSCWLKGGDVTVVQSPGSAVVAYVLLQPPSPPSPPDACNGYRREASQDIQASASFGVASAPGGDTSECCATCSATAGCSAFVLFGEACYLKGGQLTPTNNDATTAYYTTLLPPPPPPSPLPSPPPPSPSPPVLCSETCYYSSDNDCDDSGPGAEYMACTLGTDCIDCGPRSPSETSPPVPPAPPNQSHGCNEQCYYSSDNDCDDGGPGAEYNSCAIGTDCIDCGPRNPPSPPSPVPSPPPPTPPPPSPSVYSRP